MAVTQRIGHEGCPTCGDAVVGSPINGSVGVGGTNAKADVFTIQQLLNALSPLEGGPDVKLDEDSLIGPKTKAAITKYQKFALGWSDGRVDVNGPTIKALTGFIVDSPTVPFGKLGLPEGPAAKAKPHTPAPINPGDSVLGAQSIAVAHVCMRVLEPSLNTLRWKLTRATPNMMALLNKHFSHKKEKFTNKDLGHVQGVLSSIHHYIARFNAFGKLPIENVILFDPAPPGTVIARTVRGGNKMSTKQIQIYKEKKTGKLTKNPGQSIWLTSRFADQPSHEKHWTVLHEFCHFVGDRDGFPTIIEDYGYAFESQFLNLSKFKRMHNAESLSLFFLEYCIGTKAISILPSASSVKSHFDQFPKVTPSGDIVTS